MLVSFRAEPPVIEPMFDPEEVHLRIRGVFEDGEDETEWVALPFLFAIACLSFNDARSRGYSISDFEQHDQLDVHDFLPHLRLTTRGLEWRGDYIKGRRMKTDLRVTAEGLFEIETAERGEAATRWLDRLRGKRPLQAVSTVDAPPPITV